MSSFLARNRDFAVSHPGGSNGMRFRVAASYLVAGLRFLTRLGIVLFNLALWHQTIPDIHLEVGLRPSHMFIWLPPGHTVDQRCPDSRVLPDNSERDYQTRNTTGNHALQKSFGTVQVPDDPGCAHYMPTDNCRLIRRTAKTHPKLPMLLVPRSLRRLRIGQRGKMIVFSDFSSVQFCCNIEQNFGGFDGVDRPLGICIDSFRFRYKPLGCRNAATSRPPDDVATRYRMPLEPPGGAWWLAAKSLMSQAAADDPVSSCRFGFGWWDGDGLSYLE
ncbi:hypothetical protein FB45DRAFT_863194 [Roridomyces roridus]|uniref:Uncharacterized protein n=1 Tax=Roridomyces roridus TaxID=1738132 RepID=A0AAD7C936_9AGAR|nr:hypothetical protein FB45DRAFT_863194 [Roridomyces roridus]